MDNRYDKERFAFQEKLKFMVQSRDWEHFRRDACIWPPQMNNAAIRVLLGRRYDFNSVFPGQRPTVAAQWYLNISSNLAPLKMLQPFSELIGLSIFLCLPGEISDRTKKRKQRSVTWAHNVIVELQRIGMGDRATELMMFRESLSSFDRLPRLRTERFGSRLLHLKMHSFV